MSLSSLTLNFPWSRYSKKLVARIEAARCAGFFTQEDSADRGMFLAEGVEGKIDEGNCVKIYLLVDPEDGIVVDARFQVYGQSALIGAAEETCELMIGKNYDQAKRIGADLVDKELRDKSDIPAFPPETYPHLNLVIGAIEMAAEKCSHIPLAETYVAPPMPTELEVIQGGYPGWMELTLKKKIAVIKEVMDKDIRPYIALDAGGVEVMQLLHDKEVIIAYQGTCTSCMSSVGATLSYIQQVLKNKVHPDLVVIPDLDAHKH